MESKNPKETPEIMEWLGDERGDNLAIKSGLRVYTVDKYSNLYSQRYKRATSTPLTDGLFTTTISGLSDLKVGYTYSISKSEMVVGKLLESHLFGYRFLSFGPNGNASISDMDYNEIILHFQAGDIKIIRKVD